MIKVVNTITGEVFEFETDTPEQIIEAYLQASKLEAAAKRAKEKVRDLIVERDLEDYEGHEYKVKVSHVQRRTYDLSVMREVLDADQYETFIQPDKTALDAYIKEYAEVAPEAKQLRDTMVDVGDPYIQVRVERVQA